MNWQDIKFEIDRHIKRLYITPPMTGREPELADPNTLATNLVVISTLRARLAEFSVELNNQAERRKSSVYFTLLARSNVSRAKEECRLDPDYLELKKSAETVSGYLSELSALTTTVQTYLRWKAAETNL